MLGWCAWDKRLFLSLKEKESWASPPTIPPRRSQSTWEQQPQPTMDTQGKIKGCPLLSCHPNGKVYCESTLCEPSNIRVPSDGMLLRHWQIPFPKLWGLELTVRGVRPRGQQKEYFMVSVPTPTQNVFHSHSPWPGWNLKSRQLSDNNPQHQWREIHVPPWDKRIRNFSHTVSLESSQKTLLRNQGNDALRVWSKHWGAFYSPQSSWRQGRKKTFPSQILFRINARQFIRK